MSNSSQEIRSFLKDVDLSGAAIMRKQKLLWLLGWKQDRPGAWRDLLSHWVEVAGARSLRGIDVNDLIVLTTDESEKLDSVADWGKDD